MQAQRFNGVQKRVHRRALGPEETKEIFNQLDLTRRRTHTPPPKPLCVVFFPSRKLPAHECCLQIDNLDPSVLDQKVKFELDDDTLLQCQQTVEQLAAQQVELGVLEDPEHNVAVRKATGRNERVVVARWFGGKATLRQGTLSDVDLLKKPCKRLEAPVLAQLRDLVQQQAEPPGSNSDEPSDTVNNTASPGRDTPVGCAQGAEPTLGKNVPVHQDQVMVDEKGFSYVDLSLTMVAGLVQ